jgi:predicted porin
MGAHSGGAGGMKPGDRRVNASFPKAAPLGFLLLTPLMVAGSSLAQAQTAEEGVVVPDTSTDALIYEEVPDVQPRTGLPQIRHDFEGGGFVRFYGHINWGILNYDDGRETKTYAPLDNANSVSRIGLLIERPLAEDLLATVRLEMGYGPYSSFFVSQLDNDPDWKIDEDRIRWIDLNLRHDTYGALSLGQGSMATDGATLVDFSGTNVIAYSSVADSAGGQFLRFTDPTRPIDAAPTIGAAYQGFDGPRRVRVRYDTPSFMGFHASAAYGRNLLTTDGGQHDEDLVDLSVTYGGTLGDFRLGAVAGYFWDRFDREVLSGSASVIHEPTGINLSFASAELDTGTRTADYWWTKIGLRRSVFDFGDTALSADYYSGRDMTRNGAESDSIGLALVQTIDHANTELWLTWRQYDYDDPTASFEDGRAIYGGFRFRF